MSSTMVGPDRVAVSVFALIQPIAALKLLVAKRLNVMPSPGVF